MKPETKEKIVIIIFFSILIIGTTVLTILDPFNLKGIIKSLETAPKECKDLGGIYTNRGIYSQCYSYDSEGYKFYWIKEGGEYHKER